MNDRCDYVVTQILFHFNPFVKKYILIYKLKSYVLKGGGDEAVQGDDEALNDNGKALNGNWKALKCVGEALGNTLFSQKKLINMIARNMTF